MTDEIMQGTVLEIERIYPEQIEKLNQEFGTLIESLTILNGMVRLATQRMRAFVDLSDVQFPPEMTLSGQTVMEVQRPAPGPDYVLEHYLKAQVKDG